MISVFGTTFVDIKGYSKSNFNPLGRNIGAVQTIYGGVGHNVARILNYLGMDVEFISTVEPTGDGNAIVNKLIEDGVGTNHLGFANSGMGIWHATFDECGELCASISQQPDFTELENIVDTKGREIILKSEAVILEVDLNSKIARKICELAKEYNRPIYALVSNLSVVKECPELLKQFECFVCNNIEAESLLGATTETKYQLVKELSSKYELKSCVVTFGEKGSIYFDSNTELIGKQGIFEVQVVDTAGAGDSFFSGFVYGRLKGYSMEKATNIGARIASIIIGCADAVSEEVAVISTN